MIPVSLRAGPEEFSENLEQTLCSTVQHLLVSSAKV